MNLTLKNTFKKYEIMAEVLMNQLFALLKALDALEKEIFERDHALDLEKPSLNIPSHQVHPNWHALMEEYEERFKAILEGKVTEKLLSRGYATQYSQPSEYAYLDDEAFSVDFTMRKADMATIIIHYQQALEMKHKFVLRLIDGKWLVDEKYYGFENEDTWHLDRM